MKRMIVTGALLAVLLAGCGSKPSQKVYSLAKTKACLEAQPVRLGGALDFVASTATGGSVKVHTRNNFVTIVFGTDVADADNINSAYHHFAAKNVGVDDVLDQSGNAVMLWHKHPSQSDVDVVQSCLK